MPLEVGAIVEGTVSGLTKFGAFIDLEDSKKGLVHISEVSSRYVEKVEDFLTVGQKVKVKIINIEGKDKISLSIKQTEPKRPLKRRFTNDSFKPGTPPEEVVLSSYEDNGLSFEDKMQKFKKLSDERMLDIKRNIDSKRGQRKRK